MSGEVGECDVGGGRGVAVECGSVLVEGCAEWEAGLVARVSAGEGGYAKIWSPPLKTFKIRFISHSSNVSLRGCHETILLDDDLVTDISVQFFLASSRPCSSE